MPTSDAFLERLAPVILWVILRFRRIVVVAVVAILCLLLMLQAARQLATRGMSPLRGRVSVAGRPVTFGTVTVVAANGTTLTAAIQRDGTYALPHVPNGPVRIAVSSPDPQTVFQKAVADPAAAPSRKPSSTGSGAAGRSNAKGAEQSEEGSTIAMVMPIEKAPPSTEGAARPEHADWFRIPGRYASPAQSGLRATVEPRGSTADLNLEATSSKPGR